MDPDGELRQEVLSQKSYMAENPQEDLGPLNKARDQKVLKQRCRGLEFTITGGRVHLSLFSSKNI